MRHPPTNCVAVDVDGTLSAGGVLNKAVLAWAEQCRANGLFVILWSARGMEHARRMAEQFGCVQSFDAILPKPGYILDDQGWGWVRYTQVVRRLDRVPIANGNGATRTHENENDDTQECDSQK